MLTFFVKIDNSNLYQSCFYSVVERVRDCTESGGDERVVSKCEDVAECGGEVDRDTIAAGDPNIRSDNAGL